MHKELICNHGNVKFHSILKAIFKLGGGWVGAAKAAGFVNFHMAKDRNFLLTSLSLLRLLRLLKVVITIKL